MTVPHAQPDWIGRFDHVTRLPNRTQLIERLSTGLNVTRPSDRKLALVLVTLADAQHFNQLLRALGHDFSEDFIRAGAHRIESLLPESVKLYNVSVLSFAFVLDAKDKHSQDVLAEAIAAGFNDPIKLGEIPIRSRAGVGVVDLDPATSDPAETLRAALTAAQDSRQQEKPFAHYDAQTDSAHRRAFQILTDLPDALRADDQMELYYQPRIDLVSGRCVAVEALLRWKHPEIGWVSPGELFSLVESTALIKPLTEKVLSIATQQLALWSRSFGYLSVSVNVSPNNLSEPDFVERLQRLLETRDVNADRLELEFTEGAVAADDTETTLGLRQIRALGATVAIDDFGSGYSNMAYLTKIPADIIKIDKGFVQYVEPSGQSGFLLQKIADLASGLGFQVVGEGVETAEAYDFLKSIGCAQAQGYYISKPLPVGSITDWLTAHAEIFHR
ncbi:putative bifunctional diguanylate cyclase/phosphodiesterase [Roseovarius tibetensis]|uniref:putative bifunctional diguanylate cyclase/phosphodiesterase n=1 Tax=Roseovarius tibetensis TaxID=2685897 RepID=UPI003D7FA3B5